MKKKILLIATGGTIACKTGENGLTPLMSIDEILSYVPETAALCDVTGVQLFNIDSTNITPAHWLKLVRAIRDNYGEYDAFIVLHGTDTMAYTCAILSYLIQNSRKPIVVTGAQKPVGMDVTDAKTNLSDSFLYCMSDHACGVKLVFDGKVIAGTRAKKTRSKSYNAFSSINYPYVAVIRDGRIINYIDEKPVGEVRFYDDVNDKVGLIKLIPGANARALDYMCGLNDAVIIESFGTGGIPDGNGSGFYEVIERRRAEGKIIVSCTQVENEGSDMTIYKVGKGAKEKYGLIECFDMTLEATVAKLMWILGFEKNAEKVKKLFYTTIDHDILYKTE